MVEIAVPDENDSIIKLNLDNKAYSIHFKWNSVGEHWSFGILDENENTLIESIKIVPNYPLMNIFKTPFFPSGEFMAVIEDNTINRIGRQSFIDESASFIYIEEGELNELFKSS